MKISIFFILVCVVIYCCYTASVKNPYNQESLGSKKEWANLQNMDSGNGNKKQLTNNLSLVSFNGNNALLVKNNLLKCIILLDCEYPPYYKNIGDCNNLTMTLDNLKLIENNTKITTTVYRILAQKTIDSSSPNSSIENQNKRRNSVKQGKERA